MPPWKRILKDEQIGGVLDYVMQTFAKEPFRELRKRNIPEKNPVASSADSIARGEQIFLLRCTGCHGRKADGKGPNSLDILPHPRNFRNHWFVESVPDRAVVRIDSIWRPGNGHAVLDRLRLHAERRRAMSSTSSATSIPNPRRLQNVRKIAGRKPSPGRV